MLQIIGLGKSKLTAAHRAQVRAGRAGFIAAVIYAVVLAWAERRFALIPNWTVAEVILGTVIIFGAAIFGAALYAKDTLYEDTYETITVRQAVWETVGVFVVAATATGAPIFVWQVVEITLRVIGHPWASNLICR